LKTLIPHLIIQRTYKTTSIHGKLTGIIRSLLGYLPVAVKFVFLISFESLKWNKRAKVLIFCKETMGPKLLKNARFAHPICFSGKPVST